MSDVLRCGDLPFERLAQAMERHGLELTLVEDGTPIPGSYWGDEEAGLLGTTVLVRRDTPVHSLLHEGCHAICMGPKRRASLDTDALSDDAEENAVCYLQIVLANSIEGVGADRLMADMDQWGYSFRLGSTRAWFEHDAGEARAWLVERGLIEEIQEVKG